MSPPTRKVALIGFMGSGKSSVAPLLAATLHCHYIDVDREVVSRSQLDSVAEIFKTHGELFFRDLEADVTRCLAQASNIIISTGGGIIGRQSNIEHLKQNSGVIVFLQTSFETVTSRISDFSTRPLFRDETRARALFIERQPVYSAYADLVVRTDHKQPEQVRDDIIARLEGMI